METAVNKTVIISGASIAGLSTAWWLNKLGYKVTIVEIANEPRTAGAAIDLRDDTINIIKRMGIFEKLKANRLHVELIEFKNEDDITEGSISLKKEAEEHADIEIEIERDKFINVLMEELKDKIEFIFNNSITTINETPHDVGITFRSGASRNFDLLIGCDGSHSGVRKIWFGHEAEYATFMDGYFSITTVNKLLIKQKAMQMFNVPDKAVTLNAYNNKTDIVFCFFSENEISYDYRDTGQQRNMITAQFAGLGWRVAELLQEVKQSENFYFDKFCQIKMPLWTKGRVALVGDSGYCASPAAGMGASLSVIGAAALADALEKHDDNFELAFKDYNSNLRPFIDAVQAKARLNVKENFIPRTAEAIRKRNKQTTSF